MSKFVALALAVGLLAACTSVPGGYRSTDGVSTANANPPRSPGEGPSFTPYGAAGR
jgi:hypothetical protein